MEEGKEVGGSGILDDGVYKYQYYWVTHKGAHVQMSTPQSLGGSFEVVNSQPTPRLVLAVDGLDKEGKTNLALTAPGPIGYCAFDQGHEGVVEKFQTNKTVHMANYFVNIQKDMEAKQIMEATLPVWNQFLTDWKIMMQALKKGHLRTGVLDTASEAWEVLRLARFGKLTQVMPHHYTALNTEYRNLIREIYSTPGNLILLHKLKSEWIDNPATGKGGKTGGYVRSGYADTGFLVQANVLCWREKVKETGQKTGPFHVTIQNCRQRPQAAGIDLPTDVMAPGYADLPPYIPQANFQWLGLSVYPETSLEDWV